MRLSCLFCIIAKTHRISDVIFIYREPSLASKLNHPPIRSFERSSTLALLNSKSPRSAECAPTCHSEKADRKGFPDGEHPFIILQHILDSPLATHHFTIFLRQELAECDSAVAVSASVGGDYQGSLGSRLSNTDRVDVPSKQASISAFRGSNESDQQVTTLTALYSASMLAALFFILDVSRLERHRYELGKLERKLVRVQSRVAAVTSPPASFVAASAATINSNLLRHQVSVKLHGEAPRPQGLQLSPKEQADSWHMSYSGDGDSDCCTDGGAPGPAADVNTDSRMRARATAVMLANTRAQRRAVAAARRGEQLRTEMAALVGKLEAEAAELLRCSI